MKHILPRVITVVSNSNYLYRMISLRAVADFAEVIGPDVAALQILPVILSTCTDNVPNVRFCVCKTLSKLAPELPLNSVKEQVIPCSRKLIADSDIDVRFYAGEALKLCTQLC
eukprot:TRINITY_DN7443_c0_g1_i1.p1 TRINITY_DN7443_c0_g1~~TRINITY_DN7443_c0_g1_i1.p1  ORF type:complete len:113 (+),score=14.71 TRINITY_DN7443_c0_g1_i1:126-464(+)